MLTNDLRYAAWHWHLCNKESVSHKRRVIASSIRYSRTILFDLTLHFRQGALDRWFIASLLRKRVWNFVFTTFRADVRFVSSKYLAASIPSAFIDQCCWHFSTLFVLLSRFVSFEIFLRWKRSSKYSVRKKFIQNWFSRDRVPIFDEQLSRNFVRPYSCSELNSGCLHRIQIRFISRREGIIGLRAVINGSINVCLLLVNTFGTYIGYTRI